MLARRACGMSTESTSRRDVSNPGLCAEEFFGFLCGQRYAGRAIAEYSVTSLIASPVIRHFDATAEERAFDDTNAGRKYIAHHTTGSVHDDRFATVQIAFD